MNSSAGHIAPAATRPAALRSFGTLVSRRTLHIALVLVAFAIVWELAARVGIIDVLFVSYPTEILSVLPELAGEGRLRAALAATLRTMAAAVALGTVLGVALGYAMGLMRVLRDALYGPALFVMSVPKSIFIPIFMVFFGINHRSAAYYGAFSALIYVLVNVVSGFDLIEEQHLKVARAYGASPRRQLGDIIFPATMPGIFTGVWYGIKNGMNGVLIMELFISVGGLGQLLTHYSNGLESAKVFAVILGMSVAAILLGSFWSYVEKRLNRWNTQSDRNVVADG